MEVGLSGAGRLRLASVSPVAVAAGEVFEAMLSGWRDQQLARNLNLATIDARERVVRRFRSQTGAWPWEWLPGHLDAWVGELRSVEHLAHSTIRSYQLAVGGFCEFACDPAYGWTSTCMSPLLADVPAPVLAKVLNRRPWRVAQRAQTLGIDWARYASLKARQ